MRRSRTANEDVLLVPFQPRSVDLWSGTQIGADISEARRALPYRENAKTHCSLGGKGEIRARKILRRAGLNPYAPGLVSRMQESLRASLKREGI